LSIVEQILRDRQVRNEAGVAIVRFAIIAFTTFMDFLSFMGVVHMMAVPANAATIALDCGFLLFATIILIATRRRKYHASLKYFIITGDYFFVSAMMLFDPTVPQAGGVRTWTILVAVIFIFCLNLLRFSRAGTIFAGAMAYTVLLGISFFAKDFISVDFVPMLAGLGCFIMIGYVLTASNVRMMRDANAKKMMERYLPLELVNELYHNKASLEPGGQKQFVTIIFSDIRSFTSLSERLPAGEVVAILNEYLSAMTRVIFAHGGTIDKFIGDAIMTVFGAPVQKSDDALRAVRCAQAMLAEVRALNEINPHRAPLEIGIGIHSGDVIAGNIGSDQRLDYTVIGDTVNIASRIEGLTKVYGCSVLISESTVATLQNDTGFALREIDSVRLKGRSTPTGIYELLDAPVR